MATCDPCGWCESVRRGREARQRLGRLVSSTSNVLDVKPGQLAARGSPSFDGEFDGEVKAYVGKNNGRRVDRGRSRLGRRHGGP